MKYNITNKMLVVYNKVASAILKILNLHSDDAFWQQGFILYLEKFVESLKKMHGKTMSDNFSEPTIRKMEEVFDKIIDERMVLWAENKKKRK